MNRIYDTRLLTHLPQAHRVKLQAFKNGQDLAGHLQSMTCEIEFFGEKNTSYKEIQPLLYPWLDQKDSSLKFSLCIGLVPGKHWQLIEPELATLYEKGLALIHWQLDEPGQKLPKTFLWKVSKLGIWNHVSARHLFEPGVFADRTWIADTPNIVHSFEDLGAHAQQAVTAPETLQSYAKLPRLPGRPLWQIIRDPAQILSCLGQISKSELVRMRQDEASGGITSLGTHIEYYFKKPGEISPGLMEEIIAMVDAAGSVDITHVRANLKKAYLIGYAMENGCVAGNSSLKHPRQAFIDRLYGMTGLDFTHCVERGYTSVRPEYRAMGIGAKLLEGLTLRAVDVKVFSIIGEDNLATQKIAIRNKTRKIITYFSDKLEKNMGVWMPEHMIPDEWQSGKPESNQ